MGMMVVAAELPVWPVWPAHTWRTNIETRAAHSRAMGHGCSPQSVSSSSPLLRTPMNYLWGAVNAISAPYQYYKELPPLNPSTLTGAIDVIVIRRPAPGGGTELACSPFHVRFGKWQVLRPGEKKVCLCSSCSHL